MNLERAVLTIVVAVFWGALYAFVPVLSLHAASLGADLNLIGVVVGSYGLSQFLLRIPAGWLSDLWGRRKPFVTLGFSLAVVSCLGMAWAPSPWLLVAARSLSGVAATTWVPFTVLFASAFPPEQTVAAMGVASFAVNVGQILGMMAGGWVAETWGLRAPFVLGAGVAAVGLLLVAAVKERRVPRRTRMSLHELRAVVGNRGLLWVAGLCVLAQYITHATIFGFIPIYAEMLGASRMQLGWLVVASTIPAALASLRVGHMADRHGTTATLVVGFAITVVATAATPFIASLSVLFAAQVVGGLGRGIVFPLLMGLSIRTVPAPQRALAMGIFQSIYAIGMVVGPVGAGLFGTLGGMKGLFLSTAFVGLIGIAALYYSHRGHRPAQADTAPGGAEREPSRPPTSG